MSAQLLMTFVMAQHLSYDSHGTMRLLMWHPHQKDIASCMLQSLNRVDEIVTSTVHCIPTALLGE